MILYDCAANSLEIERLLLGHLGDFFKSPKDALSLAQSDESLYEITIEVKEVKR